ncbi:unnamed protein product [Echinostoma caproni]|uniref:Uncharacterized protein n=1 Tax=Echinostoma caproni TaxID=27848 RepID=A0A183BG38_9TREM|nr:unnamed protein product [Echinostoma caproni]
MLASRSAIQRGGVNQRSPDNRTTSCASYGNSNPTSRVQVSPNLPPPVVPLLLPRCPFKLATFNVRTLMRIGKQAYLARTFETLAVDVEFKIPAPLSD